MAAGTTNRISFEEASDLLGRARACVAWVVDGAPCIEPAVIRPGGEPERFVVGVTDRAAEAGEAVLVIDDGVLFFDLRAIYVRGVPSPIEEPADTGLTWFEIAPTVVSCWDYGRLRNDPEAAAAP